MQAKVTELEGSRVRIDVTVESAEVEQRVERAARALGGQMSMPGFRKGKVPPAMVLQRAGRPAVLEQMLQEALPEWYVQALRESGASTVGEPELKVEELPVEGEPLVFSIEVGVRPKAKLGEYKGLEVGRREPEVLEAAVDAELERLREGFGSLEPVEREAAAGDFVQMDFRGTIDGELFEGGEASDYVHEVGGGRLLEQMDAALHGVKAGDEPSVTVNFPDDYRAEQLAGKAAEFALTVKSVLEKRLPELDDEFAAEASEFDTLTELREDIGTKLSELVARSAEGEFREAALDAAVERAEVAVPDALAMSRAAEHFHRFEHELEHRGIDPDGYLKLEGKTREQAVAEIKPDAEQSLKREAVLAAVADAEGIEADDERERLIAAADLIADSATPIPLETAEAREKIWTPEKKREGEGALWTPGS